MGWSLVLDVEEYSFSWTDILVVVKRAVVG
jgi:hypothetical protein